MVNRRKLGVDEGGYWRAGRHHQVQRPAVRDAIEMFEALSINISEVGAQNADAFDHILPKRIVK